MELYKQLLADIICRGELVVKMPDVEGILEQTFKDKCFNALKDIKLILSDDTLDDKECFKRIEQIIRVFEREGSDCSGRHDF